MLNGSSKIGVFDHGDVALAFGSKVVEEKELNEFHYAYVIENEGAITLLADWNSIYSFDGMSVVPGFIRTTLKPGEIKIYMLETPNSVVPQLAQAIISVFY